jgi:diaminohydroxyphosphoribosylaminopyrimidine deaminase/5-amino-6-(5-phosphoribosylamino)uracil reductase
MLEAFAESMKGVGITNPNPAVGCVVVARNGLEIARGSTQAYRGLHAERFAWTQISNLDLLEEATVYLTLEPCTHFGNQPPCIDLLAQSKASRFVIACTDPNPLVNHRGVEQLRAAGKKVEIGLLSTEISLWNFPFFLQQKFQRPIFILKWAQTLDGQLADDSGQSQWISCPTSRSYAHWLRQKYDAILVGANTFLKDLPKLNARDCATPRQTQPIPIIFDPKGICLQLDKNLQSRISMTTLNMDRRMIYVTCQSNLQSTLPSATNHWITQRANTLNLLITQSMDGPEWAHELAQLLSSQRVTDYLNRPLQSVFIEGGPSTLKLLIKAGYSDFAHVFIAPILTAGHTHRIQMLQMLHNKSSFELATVSKLDSDVLMELVSHEAMNLLLNT